MNFWKIAGGIVLFVVVLGMLTDDEEGSSGAGASTTAARATRTATPAAAAAATVRLTDVSSRLSDSGSYMYTEGEVTNTSSRSLEFLRLVVSWYDSGGRFITSDVGYAEFDPVLPGQTSPFTVMTRYNPEMDRYSVTATSSRDEIRVTGVTYRDAP